MVAEPYDSEAIAAVVLQLHAERLRRGTRRNLRMGYAFAPPASRTLLAARLK
jgi:hypothetical protein